MQRQRSASLSQQLATQKVTMMTATQRKQTAADWAGGSKKKLQETMVLVAASQRKLREATFAATHN
jgi:hypothetical protein